MNNIAHVLKDKTPLEHLDSPAVFVGVCFADPFNFLHYILFFYVVYILCPNVVCVSGFSIIDCLFVFFLYKLLSNSIFFIHVYTGNPTAAEQISRTIAFFPSYFAFKNEYVKVTVKYEFVLHIGFARSPPYTSYNLLLENVWNALYISIHTNNIIFSCKFSPLKLNTFVIKKKY